MTGGKVVLRNAAPKTMEVVLNKLTEAGAIIEAGDNWISIDMQQRPKAVDIRTVVHPGFPNRHAGAVYGHERHCRRQQPRGGNHF